MSLLAQLLDTQNIQVAVIVAIVVGLFLLLVVMVVFSAISAGGFSRSRPGRGSASSICWA